MYIVKFCEISTTTILLIYKNKMRKIYLKNEKKKEEREKSKIIR